MAVTTTSRLGIIRWGASTDPFSRAHMETSHAALEDNVAMYAQGTAAARPAFGKVGRYYYATDTQVFSYDTGTTWVNVSDPNTVTLSATQTLTNKTMSGASNTFSNIPQSAVTSLTSDLALKAPLASPTFTGTVTLPTATSIGNVSSTEIGYLDGVTSAIQTQIDGKSSSAHTHASLYQPLDGDLTAIAALSGSSGLLRKTGTDTWAIETTTYAPLASPSLTGTPTAPTAAADTNTTQVATTAYVIGQGYIKSATVASTYAPLASPGFTGVPTAPTAAVDTNSTQLATTAFVISQAGASNPIMNGSVAVGTSLRYSRQDHVHPSDTSRAPLNSPTFTGVPAAPTAAVDTNTTQIATTAYVVAQGYLKTATASSTYAPLASPALTGTPTAPTASAGTNTTQVATTAFTTGGIATHAALTTTHGVSGAIVGTTDTQTLTNKTIENPVINGTITGTATLGSTTMADIFLFAGM